MMLTLTSVKATRTGPAIGGFGRENVRDVIRGVPTADVARWCGVRTKEVKSMSDEVMTAPEEQALFQLSNGRYIMDETQSRVMFQIKEAVDIHHKMC